MVAQDDGLLVLFQQVARHDFGSPLWELRQRQVEELCALDVGAKELVGFADVDQLVFFLDGFRGGGGEEVAQLGRGHVAGGGGFAHDLFWLYKRKE